MPINIGKLELEIGKKIGSSTDPTDLQLLANSVKQLKNTPIDYVSAYANLPASSASNKGKMYYVDSECTVYWSTGLCNYPLQSSTGITTMYAWGRNYCGQLGNNSLIDTSSPVTTVGGIINWCQVSGGYTHTTALRSDGTILSWGWNNYGQLGNNTIVTASSPVSVVGSSWCYISTGMHHVGGIKTDGTLWTWGYNTGGMLGTGNITTYSSPVTTVAGGTTWCSIGFSSYSSNGIKTDGTLWTWGRNTCGELGNGTITCSVSPITTIAGGTNWCQVAGGTWNTAAIKTDGTLWTWGNNTCGLLGTGGTTNYSSPVTTSGGGTTWCTVSAGCCQMSGIKTDGTLWSWGVNTGGGLGTGGTTNYSSPVTTAGGGTTWCQVGSGCNNIVAIKTNGTLWVWGSGLYGKLGTGNTTNYSSPVTTAGGGTNWYKVSTGRDHTIAIACQPY